MALRDKLIFTCGEGTLIDLINRVVPNWSRPTPVNMTREIGGSIQLEPVEAHRPAFNPNTGAFLIEPPGTNLLTWNLALNQNVWQKGSNVIVRPDTAPAPDASYLADRVLFASGTGNTQKLLRNLSLEAATSYTLHLILRLTGGRFGAADYVRVTGDVVGTVETSLTTLNGSLNQYKLLSLTFTTAGTQPTLPGNEGESSEYTITAVGTNTVTLSGLPSVAADDLVGGQVTFDTTGSTAFPITANTAQSGGSITVTVDAVDLAAAGVTTSSKATFAGPPPAACVLELYSENTASIDWGGAQLEASPIRTSMIYQESEQRPRAGATLTVLNSPFKDRDSMAAYIEMEEWRGDGNLFDAGNFKAWVEDGVVKASANAIAISDTAPLPATPARILLQASAESASLSLYVNGVLRARSTLTGFSGGASQLRFTSSGMRSHLRFFVFDGALLDGQTAVGEAAQQEVKELFDSPSSVLSAADIASRSPVLNLPTVTIPAPDAPTARSKITAVNTGTRVITVESGTNFSIGDAIAILRGSSVISLPVITNKATNDLTLDGLVGVKVGDFAVKGNYDRPGKASIRLPWTPIDPQIISAIDVGTRKVSVTSTLAFTRQRAFVSTSQGQDVSEVLIEAIDNTANTLTLSSIANVEVGHSIAQPAAELLISPWNYRVSLREPINGVKVAQKSQNAVVIENATVGDVSVTPLISVEAY